MADRDVVLPQRATPSGRIPDGVESLFKAEVRATCAKNPQLLVNQRCCPDVTNGVDSHDLMRQGEDHNWDRLWGPMNHQDAPPPTPRHRTPEATSSRSVEVTNIALAVVIAIR